MLGKGLTDGIRLPVLVYGCMHWTWYASLSISVYAPSSCSYSCAVRLGGRGPCRLYLRSPKIRVALWLIPLIFPYPPFWCEAYECCCWQCSIRQLNRIKSLKWFLHCIDMQKCEIATMVYRRRDSAVLFSIKWWNANRELESHKITCQQCSQ